MKNKIMTRNELAKTMGVHPQSLNWFADTVVSNVEVYSSALLGRGDCDDSPTRFSCFRGAIMDADTGKPITDAQICLENVNGHSVETYTNASGEYQLSTMLHGRCKGIVRRKGYESKFVMVALRNGLFTFYDIMLIRK